jgi:hypothetical protein
MPIGTSADRSRKEALPTSLGLGLYEDLVPRRGYGKISERIPNVNGWGNVFDGRRRER